MCFSATVSYGATAVLVTTGMYAVQQGRRMPPAYLMWALIPVFFGLQQAFEGRVWQELDAGHAGAAVPYALGFHFFSHFLWLWWIPLCCYLVEPRLAGTAAMLRRKVMAGCAMFGAFAGTLVYSTLLFHPEWMSVSVKLHSIVYDISVPFPSPFHLPVTPAALYALTILVPLFISSHILIRIFGVLVVFSMVFASDFYGYAYVSVWCFFAAVLSLYIVYMTPRLATSGHDADRLSAPSEG
ncbi:MAG: hypothetical protein LJE57_06125 [Gallionella sp.]|nr:hypothetical protein [Gallionella sp.]